MRPDGMRKDSGTCNVCSAPCSSCMHRIAVDSEPNVKHKCKREASACSSDCAKSRACYYVQCAASEASNLPGAISNQNSYSDSVGTLSVMRPFLVDETSEAVDMPVKFPAVEKVGKNHQVNEKSCCHVSELLHSTVNGEQQEECHEDNGSCSLGSGNFGNMVMNSDVDLPQNMSLSCAFERTSGDEVFKVSQVKGSDDFTAGRCVSGRKSSHENSKNFQMLSKVNKEPIECLVGVVKPSFTGSLTDVGDATGKPIFLNSEIKQTGQTRNNLSSQALENEKCFRGGGVEVDEYHEISICNENNEQLEKCSPVLVESNEQGLDIQGQFHSMAGALNSDLDNRLIDVNVCDICGDAGREALLATCSRCTDGAEHIYCMRVKLDKVPEGNWICEQCELEVKTEKTEDFSAILISNNLEGSNKVILKPESSARPKSSVKWSGKTVGSKACESLKVSCKPFKLQKHIMRAGRIPAVIKEQFETSNVLTSSPSRAKSPKFAHCKSFKRMEMMKQNSATAVSSPQIHSRSSFQALSRTNSMGSIALKTQKDLCSSKVLSKQVSFDISKIRPKDKLLVEGQAQKLIRESMSNGTTKDAPVRLIAKSTSFKSVNSGSPRAELVNKAQVLKPRLLEDRNTSVDKCQPFKSPQLEDMTGIRTSKEKNKIGRQKVTSPVQSVVSMAPRARVLPLKIEQKTPFDVEVHNKSDCTTLSTNRTLCHAKRTGYEGQVQNTSSTSTSISKNKKSNVNEVIVAEGSFRTKTRTNNSRFDIEKGLGKVPSKTLSLASSAFVSDKSKKSTANRPEKAIPSCEKEIGIHKGNDANTTKLCSTQKPTDAAEEIIRASRLKDASEEIIQNNKMKENSRPVEQIQECTVMSSNGAGHTTKFCPIQKPNDGTEGSKRGGRRNDAFQAVIKKNKTEKSCKLPVQNEECTMMSDSTALNENIRPVEQIEACTVTSSNDASHTTDYAIQEPTDGTEGSKMGGRLKGAFQAVVKKNKMEKSSKLLDQNEECTMMSDNMTPNVAPANTLLLKCEKNLPSKDNCQWQQKLTSRTSDSSETELAFAMRQEKQFSEALCHSSLASMDAAVANCDKLIPDKELVNLRTQLLPDQSPVTAGVAASVIPQHESIWQGAFEILSEGNACKLVNGIQAHLASYVSSNVLEIVRHIPTKIQLEGVPRFTVMPVQFQRTNPTDESIALYFFAKDAHSYERSYEKLLDSVFRNDMALRGMVNGVELLIFPSNMLPDNCQRWNMLLFFWGVFRPRIENSSRPQSDLPEALCSSTISRELSSPQCEMSMSWKIDADENPSKANIRTDEMPESNKPAEESTLDVIKHEKAALTPEVQQRSLFGPLPKCSISSNLKGVEESPCKEETTSKEASVKPEIVLEENIVEGSHINSSLRPNLKRSYSSSAATDRSRASELFTRSDSWHENHASFSKDVKKVARIKCHNQEEHVVSVPCHQSVVRNPSVKVFHLFGKVVEQLPSDEHSENMPSECPYKNRDLRLFGQGILMRQTEGNLGGIHSSLVQEAPNAESPDLELSLGNPKRMPKAALPLLRLPVDDRSKQISSGALALDEENITLSLASPGTESENSRKPTLKTEQLFPEGSFFKTCRAPFRSFAYT